MIPSLDSRRARNWKRIAVALIILSPLLYAVGAWATAYLPLAEPVQNGGTFPPLGQSDVALLACPYTLVLNDYRSRAIRFTGTLSGDCTVVAPLEQGIDYVLTNATSGGHNVIFGGATGATVIVAPGTSSPVAVTCPDGANFYLLGGAGGGSFDALAPPPLGGSVPNIGSFSSLFMSGAIQWEAGTPPDFSPVLVTMGNANYTVLSTEYNHFVLNVGSGGTTLTAPRNLVLPAVSGSAWLVHNLTVGGQTINVNVGTSGYDVENGDSALVWTDGTTVFGKKMPANGAFSTVDSGSILTDAAVANSVSANYYALIGNNGASGEGRLINRVTFLDTTTWVNIFGPFVPVAGDQPDIYIVLEAHDWSGLPDAGLALSDGSTGTADGSIPSGKFYTHSYKAHIGQLLVLPDGGSGSTLYCSSQGANPAMSNTVCALSAGWVDGMNGCTTTNTDAGCTSTGGSTPFSVQVLIDGGSFMVQARPESVATDGAVIQSVTTLPWRARAKFTIDPAAQ